MGCETRRGALPAVLRRSDLLAGRANNSSKC